MRRSFFSAAITTLLVACSPPAQRETEAPSAETAPQMQACNEIEPNLSRMVRIEEVSGIISARGALLGGPVAPGQYDLTRAFRFGQGNWSGERAIALQVDENASGELVFNWAGTTPNGQIDRWTATFAAAGAQSQIAYTCGRIGTVPAGYGTDADTLQLRLTDGPNGSLLMDFQRRG